MQLDGTDTEVRPSEINSKVETLEGSVKIFNLQQQGNVPFQCHWERQ